MWSVHTRIRCPQVTIGSGRAHLRCPIVRARQHKMVMTVANHSNIDPLYTSALVVSVPQAATRYCIMEEFPFHDWVEMPYALPSWYRFITMVVQIVHFGHL